MLLLNVFKILSILIVFSVQKCFCTFSINNKQEIEKIEPDKIEIIAGTQGIKEKQPEKNILPLAATLPGGVAAVGSAPMGTSLPNPYLMFNYVRQHIQSLLRKRKKVDFIFLFLTQPEPSWRALAILIPDSSTNNSSDNNDIKGQIVFHQWSPNNFVRITINATGIPYGKHAVHIHFYGDISQGCKSTGPHYESHFVKYLIFIIKI